jgi:riboflavin kinase/FMN adenylyltransferase
MSRSRKAGRALAIGKFDALHLGHRELLRRAATHATPTLLGFTGMAAELRWDARAPLVDAPERARVLARWNADLDAAAGEIFLPFAAIRPLDAGAFLDLVRAALGAVALVVGDDFRCGRGRATGVDELAGLAQARGLVLDVVPPVLVAGAPASSSRVHEALAVGDVASAAAVLGRPYRIAGVVAHGAGRGRTIGVPTANLAAITTHIPAIGVYAARAWHRGNAYAAAVNIGRAPTVGSGRAVIVEAHFIGAQVELYGDEVQIDFLARLRDEQRFAGLDALKAQLATDIRQAELIAR